MEKKRKKQHIGKRILNILLPARCIACDSLILDEQAGICADCWKELEFIGDPMCKRCGVPFTFIFDTTENLLCGECIKKLPPFKQAKYVFKYSDKSKKLILALKYGDRTDTVDVLSDFMIKAGEDILKRVDVIIPVPLHKFRLLKRKYNQSSLLAKAIAKKTGKEFIADAIIRTKHTKPQGHFTRNKRANNLKNAFRANPKYNLRKKRILIIDDVMTTGATINNCIKAIKKKNAGCQFYVLGIAKVLLHDD